MPKPPRRAPSKAPSKPSPEARIAELEGELERARATSAALREIGRALGSTIDLEELLNGILAQTTEVLDADRATLYLLDGDRLTSRMMVGAKAATIDVALGQGIAGHVAKTGRPLRVRDAYRDRRFDRAWDELSGYRTRSMLAVPLKNHEAKTIGVVQVLNKRGPAGKPAEFTQHDAQLLEALGSLTAVALEKARLVRSLMVNNDQLSSTKDRLEHSLHDLEFLYQLEAAMGRGNALDDIARSVITMTARTCEAAAGALLVEASPGQLQLFVVSLDRPTEVRKVMVRPGEGIAARALQRREQLSADSAAQIDDPARVRKLVGLEVRSAVALPLCGESPRACGALCLYNLERGRVPFGASEGSLLGLVTASVSLQLRLFRAREDRERQDRLTTIGRLLSGVMHDLKTPLTLISGYLELMVDTDDRAVRREYGVTITEQFEVIATMQREILAYARGERSVLLRKIYLRQFFEELSHQIEHEIGSSPVKLVLDVEEHGAAFFDGGKIARAVTNLAHNAIDAMEHKGGTLYLGCHNDEAEVVITVADTGPGIPEAVRSRLFEPFVTSGKATGNGLGLSIVKGIVDEHGGRVDVQSSARGTRFTLRLPQNVPPASRRVESPSP